VNACFSCGRDGIPLFDVGCVNKKIRACAACVAKHGVTELKDAADCALEFLLSPAGRRLIQPPAFCGHCGDPVVVGFDGKASLLCQECDRERLQVANA
jgi:hypothetical protein